MYQIYIKLIDYPDELVDFAGSESQARDIAAMYEQKYNVPTYYVNLGGDHV